MNERKWRQPVFQLYLITKSRARYRRELALPTSSAAVDLWKMMLRMMFQTFFVWTAYLLNVSTLCVCVCMFARIDFLFTVFVCSLYRLLATFKLLHYFGFGRSRLCWTHFLYHWRKIRSILCQLTQISKRQRNPWLEIYIYIYNINPVQNKTGLLHCL